MANSVAGTISSIFEAFNGIDLTATLEMVTKFIENSSKENKKLKAIANILNWIIHLQKVTKTVTPVVHQAVDTFSSAQAAQQAQLPDPKKVAFQQLLKIALEDGVVTEAERNFLLPHAIDAGYSEDELDAMILSGTHQ